MKSWWPHMYEMVRWLVRRGERCGGCARGGAVCLVLGLLVLAPPLAGAAGVRARFALEERRGSPFPSDRFTVADMTQNTGRRVALPKPDCAVQPNDCADLDVINTLDGFNVQPRLSIPFDGPIDVTSVTSQTVFLVRLGSTLPGGAPSSSQVIGINQVVWDVATTTLHVESDEILEQHTRYALLVSCEVRDAAGDPVEADERFRQLRHDRHVRQPGHDPVLQWYRQELLDALAAVQALGMAEENLAVASVFTTQSVTAALEKIRDQITRGTPAPADFALEAAGTPAVYPLTALTDLVFVRQTGTAPSFSAVPTPFFLLSQMVPGAVGTVAFGTYVSPDYLTADRIIPLASTRLDTPHVQRTAEIFFTLILPAGSPPPAGGQ